MQVRHLVFIIIASFLFSCSVFQPPPRPAWVDNPVGSNPDFVYVTGVCWQAPTTSAARMCAIMDAEKKVSDALQRKGIKIRDENVKALHYENGGASGEDLGNGWVEVAYPRNEKGKDAAK